MKPLLILFLFITLVSCGQISGDSTGANDTKISGILGGQSYISLNDNQVLFEKGVQGSTGDVSHNFEVKIDMNISNTATFYFFTDKNLNNGVKLKLVKDATNLTMTFSLNNVSHTHQTNSISGNIVHLSIDVHNDHDDAAHILMWNMHSNEPFSSEEECAYENTCLYNTESFTDPNPGPWGSQGKASGRFWGFEGEKEMIIQLKGPQDPLSNA